MEFPLGRQNLYHELQKPDDDIDLAAAALYIAQEEYSSLDVEEYLNALDTMADEVAERLPDERYPMRVIQTVNQYLFDDLGYHGDSETYYDPRNSFLNDVIERRTGIPITLSLVYLEVAQRIDFPMAGVGLPGHFLIRPVQQEMEIFVDVFHNGEILFSEDCENLLKQLYGPAARLQDQFLDVVDKRQFLMRMLSNLKAIYLKQGELLKTLSAIERIMLIFPDNVMEQRDRGILYYHTGRWTEAKVDLSYYLDAVPLAQDADVIQRLIEQME